MNTVTWKIYYGDGSTFSSGDGSWEDAPDTDVQVVITYQKHPYTVRHDGVDEYCLPHETAVKYGSWMDTDEFYKLQAIAYTSTNEVT